VQFCQPSRRGQEKGTNVAPSILVNAGPWLPVPPDGYGGIENVVATLVPELRARGVRVVLATVGASTLEADERVTVFDGPQFRRLREPYASSVGVAHAHMQGVINALRVHDVDLVHDHQEVVGPAILALLGERAPPAIQTLHWDPARHARFYADFDGRGRVFFAGVSRRQLEVSPPRLRAQAIGVVHLGVCLDDFPFRPGTGKDFVQLARITPLKGQHLAVRLGVPVVLAGHVEDDAYWQAEVAPHVDGEHVRWVGSVAGAERLKLLSSAAAALFPVQWEEPGGTAVVEALACGTPVLALRRGCLPELVDHGVTGFLADTPEELAAYARRVEEIDRAACRRAAEDRFGAARVADGYLELYEAVIRRAPRTPPG
jgi:glycosyltransferase involved in cell wall biosynthesis